MSKFRPNQKHTDISTDGEYSGSINTVHYVAGNETNMDDSAVDIPSCTASDRMNNEQESVSDISSLGDASSGYRSEDEPVISKNLVISMSSLMPVNAKLTEPKIYHY